VPLFEIDTAGELVPFRRLRGGAELYEREIEDLAWANPEEITGETLFLVQRQPQLRDGGKPDIVALDRSGRVVVVEVKREFDRGQLAQCLEYAGWARRTNLDELAQMYRHARSGSSLTGRSSPSPRAL
jgi:Holliday junction resolvase-like predicted endonuclease